MKNIKIGPHVRELRCARQTQTRFLRRGLKIGTHLSEQEGQYAEVRRHELLAVGGPPFLDVLVRRAGAHAQQAHVQQRALLPQRRPHRRALRSLHQFRLFKNIANSVKEYAVESMRNA